MSKHYNGELNAFTLWFARGLLVAASSMVALLYHQIETSVDALKAFQNSTLSRIATIEEALRHYHKLP